MKRFAIGVIVLFAGIIVTGWAALSLGTPNIGIGSLWSEMVHGAERIQLIIWEVRLPRFVLAVLCGSGLAVAGLVLQSVLRNPLAGPEIIGVSSGAAAVIAAIVVFQLPIPFLLYPPSAFVGSLLAGSVVLWAIYRFNQPTMFVLVGAAISSLFQAVVLAMISVGAPTQTSLLFTYLLGSLANRGWNAVVLSMPWIVAGVTVVMMLSRQLNLLQMRDDIPQGLGMKVVRYRLILVGIAVLIVGAVVAICGPIGYVALLSPHIAKGWLTTKDMRMIVPLTALTGALLLSLSDLFARQALYPLELPVGAWTTVIGGPFLLWFLSSRGRGSY